jgi:hypothetical protein
MMAGMSTAGATEASPPAGEHLDDERALRDVARQVALSYPWASGEHVAALLRANFYAAGGAKAQDHRLVLAERDTRVCLRREAPSAWR